jgi:4-amino-4-deoxy-L-arabinose transferase-like glycosyltransferase
MLKKLLYNRQVPFWLIAFSALVGLTLPILIQDGMFMDAMLYTSVSHNLSMGIGTFWFPQFSVHNIAGLPSFHEQPPMVFGIQSLFFKVFGDSLYVERFYTFLAMCITAMLINLLWKEILKENKGLRKLGWLPILLWITIPVCFWSYSNNMQENTMGIFTLSSVLIIYKAFHKQKFQIISWVLAGILVFIATLCKGVPGFFPIIIPFLYWLITRKISFAKTFWSTLIITLVLLITYGVLFLIPESKESLSIYFFKRALHRINEVPTVDNRFWILYRLFTELLPQILLAIIIFLVAKIKKIKTYFSEQIRESLFFILIGLSASAPLMLTLVQKGFYFVPSLPFFAIGIALLIAPVTSNLTERINPQKKKFKILLLLCSLLFVATTVFAFMQKGKTSRNQEMLHDVYLIGTVVPKQTTVTIPGNMWDEWDLKCYLVRYFNISVEPDYQLQYYIQDKLMDANIPPEYKKVNIPTLQFDLYMKKLPERI